MFNPAALREFVSLVSAAERSKKTQVTISTDIARRMADDLTYLMLSLTQAQEQNIKLQEQVTTDSVTEVELQGGKFS
jgi:hypothetical protein